MPQFLKDRLAAEAAAKGMTGRAADRYIYGAMNNRGYMRGNQETRKGVALQTKHNRDEAAGTAAPMPTLTATPKVGRRMAHGFMHPGRNLGKWLHPKREPY